MGLWARLTGRETARDRSYPPSRTPEGTDQSPEQEDAERLILAQLLVRQSDAPRMPVPAAVTQFVDQYAPTLLDLALRVDEPFRIAVAYPRVHHRDSAPPSTGRDPYPLVSGELARLGRRMLAEPWEAVGWPLGIVLERHPGGGTQALSVTVLHDRTTPGTAGTAPPQVIDSATPRFPVLRLRDLARRDPRWQPVWLDETLAALRRDAGWRIVPNSADRSAEIAAIPPHVARLDPRAPRSLQAAADRHS